MWFLFELPNGGFLFETWSSTGGIEPSTICFAVLLFHCAIRALALYNTCFIISLSVMMKLRNKSLAFGGEMFKLERKLLLPENLAASNFTWFCSAVTSFYLMFTFSSLLLLLCCCLSPKFQLPLPSTLRCSRSLHTHDLLRLSSRADSLSVKIRLYLCGLRLVIMFLSADRIISAKRMPRKLIHWTSVLFHRWVNMR